jgi:S-disulfanyl-L-cysteine oxidoreductase SoxD
MNPMTCRAAWAATAILIVAVLAPRSLTGEEGAAAVFTAQQATAGKAAFAKTCASCHMPDLSGNNEVPALAGPTFIGTWRDRTTKDLFEYMSTSMPPGGPALDTATYLSIAAYILQANGGAASGDPFTASTSVPIRRVPAPREPPK